LFVLLAQNIILGTKSCNIRYKWWNYMPLIPQGNLKGIQF